MVLMYSTDNMSDRQQEDIRATRMISYFLAYWLSKMCRLGLSRKTSLSFSRDTSDRIINALTLVATCPAAISCKVGSPDKLRPWFEAVLSRLPDDSSDETRAGLDICH